MRISSAALRLLVSVVSFGGIRSFPVHQDRKRKQNHERRSVECERLARSRSMGAEADVEADAEAEALESGAVQDADSMERTVEVTKSVNEAVIAEVEKSDSLSADAKKDFAKALVPYIAGLVETSKISDAAADFIQGASDTISSASFTEKVSVTNKLAPGMYVAKNAPGFAVSLYDSSKTLIAFAESQGIDVPDDALEEVSFN